MVHPRSTITASSSKKKTMNEHLFPKLVGGVGEMTSNNGTQYYQQDRIYDADAIAMAHPSQLPGGSYYYMIKKTAFR